MEEDHERALGSALRGAEMSTSMAATFTRSALMYERLADAARSSDTAERYLGHARRLADRARQELVDAEWFSSIARAHRSSRTGAGGAGWSADAPRAGS